MKFEWDEDKNQLNLKKHGIDFETKGNESEMVCSLFDCIKEVFKKS